MKQLLRSTTHRYYLFSLLKDCAFFTAVLVPFFTEWGGISLFQVQILQSWFMFWLFVLEVPTGAIADKFGRKHSMALGGVVVTIAVLVYASMPNFAIFLLAEFLFAVAMALISGADSALLYDALKESGNEDQSKKIFGRAHSFHLLGMLIAGPVGSLIAAQFGLRAPTIASAIPFLLAAGVAWSIPEPKRGNTTSQSPNYLETVRGGLSFLRHHRFARILTLNAILVSAAVYYVVWFYQPVLSQLTIPIVYFGWIHAILVSSEILVANNFSKIERLFGSERRYLQFTALIVTVSFLLVAIFPNIVTLGIFILFAGGFGLTRIEYITVLLQKEIPSHQRATVLSSISMFRRFALFMINPIVGLLATRSLSLALALVGLLPLLTFLLPKITFPSPEAKTR